MMIERMLRLYFTEDMNLCEALLFENYRNNALYQMLKSIQLNNKESHTLALIICNLNDICEKTGVFTTKDDLDWKKSEKFVTMDLENEFIVSPTQIITANIS